MSEVPPVTASETPPRASGAIAPIALLTTCVIGLAISSLSTRDHVRFRTSGGTEAGACAALIESGCRSAHASAAAELFSVPISHFGSAFYLGGATLAVVALVLGRRQPQDWTAANVAPLVTLMGLGAGAYSAFLAALLIRSGEPCPFCIALYVVNAALLALGLVWWRSARWRLKLPALLVPGALAFVVGGTSFAVTTPFLLGAMAKKEPLKPTSASVATSAGQPTLAFPEGLPSKGSANAEDDLVEFSDLDCPHCALTHHTVSAVFRERGPSRLRVRFVNFPLDQECNTKVARSLHPTACLAARGAICAQEQGLFWQYVDAYFSLSEPRSRALVFDTAQSVNIDTDRFKECLDAEQTSRTLADDIALALAAGVRATPTVLVNGQAYEGALPQEHVQKLLDESNPNGSAQRFPDGPRCTTTIATVTAVGNR